jgi:predicted AAA+ superfamily ATPase
VHLDLERPSDLRKLADPEAFFSLHRDVLVCLDEIQRVPDLFPVLRSVVDQQGRNGQFLVLGSASPGLLRQGSESLAGRISFLELTPFLLNEVVGESPSRDTQTLWLRGGFPRSHLAGSDRSSYGWRANFVRTFLERDIPQLGSSVPSERLGRFWRMCAHEHGQVLNASKLASALGVSGHTVRSYLDLLEKTFMVRLLAPCEANLKKRLVKSPKVYLRDSGVLHALLEIRSHDDLLGHPARGASWEGYVIDQVIALLPSWRPSFFRTRVGAEIDLVLELGRRRIAIECKASSAPKLARGFWSGLEDLGIEEAYVVAPVDAPYPVAPGIAVLPLAELLAWAPELDAGRPHPVVAATR